MPGGAGLSWHRVEDAYREWMPLKPGDQAPDFTLLDQSSAPVSLSDYKGRKVLVFFYPKADTTG